MHAKAKTKRRKGLRQPMRKGLPNCVQAAQTGGKPATCVKRMPSWAANPPSRKQMQLILKTCTLEQQARQVQKGTCHEPETLKWNESTLQGRLRTQTLRALLRNRFRLRLRLCVSLNILSAQERRAHPDLNQGPADLQSAALATELCTHGCVARGKGNVLQCALSSPPAR